MLTAEQELEQLRTQLAGCLTAAEGWTQNPAERSDYGWSPAYQAVLDLRRKFDASERKRDAILRLLDGYFNVTGQRAERAEAHLKDVVRILGGRSDLARDADP